MANMLSIIIPVYFNAGSLEALIESLEKEVVPYVDDYEIIMVDDGSKDESWEVMLKLQKAHKKISVLKMSRNYGSHVAVMAGFSVAHGDCVVSKAADMQEPAHLLVEMYNKWKDHNKVVIAVRKGRQESKVKVAFANLYYWLVRKMALKNMPKSGFDICLLDRQVLDVLQKMNEANSAITMQVLWTGFTPAVVEYTRLERKVGKSRWTFARKFKLFMDSLIGFSYIPIRVMTTVGLLYIIAAAIWGIRILVRVVGGDIPVVGWSSIVLLLLISLGIIMVMLGILGEYIWRTLEASRNRPLFVIDEYISHIDEEEY